MPKLIFNHTKPNSSIQWVLPVTPYHLNCTEPEDTLVVGEGMNSIESDVDPAYAGYVGKEVQVISDTELKIIYTFDTIANRNKARELLSFHIRCQIITTKSIPECKPNEMVTMSIID